MRGIWLRWYGHDERKKNYEIIRKVRVEAVKRSLERGRLKENKDRLFDRDMWKCGVNEEKFMDREISIKYVLGCTHFNVLLIFMNKVSNFVLSILSFSHALMYNFFFEGKEKNRFACN